MIVFVLRHADRQAEPVDDLTSTGEERAKLLAWMLDNTGISVAYHSGFVRARRTLEPLKEKLGSALSIIGLDDVATTIAAVRNQPPDSVIAVVGHSNTVGPIISGLGGGPVDSIGAHEFNKLFILCIGSAGATTLIRLKYGLPAEV